MIKQITTTVECLTTSSRNPAADESGLVASLGRRVVDETVTADTAAPVVGPARTTRASSTVARLATFTIGSSSLGIFLADHRIHSRHKVVVVVVRFRKFRRWWRSRLPARIGRRRGLSSVVALVEDVVGCGEIGCCRRL